FASTAPGTIFCSVATATNFSFSVYGTKGLAEISGAGLQKFRFVPCSDTAPTGQITAPPDEVIEHAGVDVLNTELLAFARAIRERTPYPIPIDDILHGMAVFDAVVKSPRTGRIEPVNQKTGA